MGVSRSSFYAVLEAEHEDAVIVAEIRAITDEFAAYGYRRVGAELRHRGRIVNAKKVRRLMKENDLNPRRRRRWTTSSGPPTKTLLRRPFESAQYAAEKHRALLTKHGLVGSMSRRGNPYDNPQAESFMKTLKVEDIYVMDYETYDEVAIGLPRFLE